MVVGILYQPSPGVVFLPAAFFKGFDAAFPADLSDAGGQALCFRFLFR